MQIPVPTPQPPPAGGWLSQQGSDIGKRARSQPPGIPHGGNGTRKEIAEPWEAVVCGEAVLQCQQGRVNTLTLRN